MDIQDLNNIIAEISNLKNRGIVLSEILDTERIMSEFENINNQFKHGRYVLSKMYSLIKKNKKINYRLIV